MEEVWKEIEGTNGRFYVSNYGNIKSVNYNYNPKNPKERFLKPSKEKEKGYMCVHLFKRGKRHMVHRLEAIAFLEIPEHLKHLPIEKLQVNHKDENKENNFIYVNEDGSVDLEKSNLEWCDNKYNCNYGTRNKRSGLHRINHPLKSTKVTQYTLDGEYVNDYPSQAEAHRQTGIPQHIISRQCNGKIKHPKDFIWKFS